MPRTRTIVISLAGLCLSWLLWRVAKRRASTSDYQYAAPRPFPFRPVPPTPPTPSEALSADTSTAGTLRTEEAVSPFNGGASIPEHEGAPGAAADLTATTDQETRAETGASAVPDTVTSPLADEGEDATMPDTREVPTEEIIPTADTVAHTEPGMAPALMGPPPLEPEPDTASTPTAEPPIDAEAVSAAGPTAESSAELERDTAPAATTETSAEAGPELDTTSAPVSESVTEAEPDTMPTAGASTEPDAPPATTPALPTEAEPAKPDDLMLIEGIGPKISTIVMAAGITTFKQLAATDAARLKQILQDAGIQTANPITWPIQARLAAQGRWDALRELQYRIKNGRLER